MSNFYREQFVDWFNDRSGQLATEWLEGQAYDKEDHLALIEGNHHESDEFYKWAEEQFDDSVRAHNS